MYSGCLISVSVSMIWVRERRFMFITFIVRKPGSCVRKTRRYVALVVCDPLIPSEEITAVGGRLFSFFRRWHTWYFIVILRNIKVPGKFLFLRGDEGDFPNIFCSTIFPAVGRAGLPPSLLEMLQGRRRRDPFLRG